MRGLGGTEGAKSVKSQMVMEMLVLLLHDCLLICICEGRVDREACLQLLHFQQNFHRISFVWVFQTMFVWFTISNIIFTKLSSLKVNRESLLWKYAAHIISCEQQL